MRSIGLGPVVIVGAGIGGLVTAALLAKAGADVTVLEAHIYPGGCAGTFYHRGYRFDAGATLAAGFGADAATSGGGMTRLGAELGIDWPTEPAREAMVVHLPGGQAVTRWTDAAAWRAEREAVFGKGAEPFWQWQEATADLLWDLAARGLAWPPAGLSDIASLAGAGLRLAGCGPSRLVGLAADAFRPAAARLGNLANCPTTRRATTAWTGQNPANCAETGPASDLLRLFVDAQLLISAQAASPRANALYAAAALDLPRRGVVHLRGGMGALGQVLTEAVRKQGGTVLFRHQVTRVTHEGQGFRIETNRNDQFPADLVIFDLPPWDAAGLMEPQARSRAALPRRAASVPADGWGAFVLYAGIDAAAVPAGFPLHHQVVVREPLGEGNTIFMTLSLPGDATRAPEGHRAVTISTHTALAPWWGLFERDRPAYEARKAEWTERVWAAAEIALPGVQAAARLALPGTPVTFQRFTHRTGGWVGGFPQTSLGRALSPRLGPGLWLVGDSIFPGQSTLAVTLGARRVADAVRREAGRRAATYAGWPRARLAENRPRQG